MKGTTTRLEVYLRLFEYIGVQWPWQIPWAISPSPSWVSYPLSVCYGLSVLILVWLLSFNPYVVAGQNLLGWCCSPMNQSSVNMVTTDDNSLSFQCLGSIFCWMNTPSSGSPPPCNVSPHWACQYATPSIFPATVALWTLAFQNCLCVLMGFGWTVAVYRSHYLTHILVLAKYVKLPLWKMVLILSVRHLGGGGDTRWADSARHYSSEGEYKRIYSCH